MKHTARLFAFVLAFVGSISAAFAAGTFGAEFTVTKPKLYNAQLIDRTEDDDISSLEGRKSLEAFAESIRKKCAECAIVPMKDRYDLPIYRVTLPEGFSFDLTLDPAVIEIVPQAATLEGFKKLEPQLQSLIFDTAKTLKQRPYVEYGGGHVHLGIESNFKGNPVLFRNYFVDWLNHADIQKAFMSESDNSPTLHELPKKHAKEMALVIQEFDQLLEKEGFLANPAKDSKRGLELMEHFARLVQTRVYTRSAIKSWTPAEKYQALNMTRLANPAVPWSQKTIELRFFDAQKSVFEFIQLIEMLDGRIRFLEGKSGLIAHEPLAVYSKKATAERLETFAREAGSTASNLRASLRDPSVRRLIAVPAPLCRRVWVN